jgi:hypothetical protein
MKNNNSFNWAEFFEGACYGLLFTFIIALAFLFLIPK